VSSMISAVAFAGFQRRGYQIPVRAIRRCGTVVALLVMLAVGAAAGDLQIKIPKRTKPTPVQALNQDGVKALNKHDLAHARRDFYKAYLIDPDDPFTLNNLGYLAELDGEIDKAQKFYDLAAVNTSDATVAMSSNGDLQGKVVSQVAGNAVSAPMQVNRLNVAAMGMMSKDRAPEAEITLRKALALDAKNPFTLNNMGYALEKEGELEQAISFYSSAEASGSKEKVVVAFDRSWRGRSISEIAARNAQAARRELAGEGSTEARVARLNLRGVSALNRNQTAAARKYFLEAYRLDPGNAFSLNNMGYISEAEGDRESADFYYAKVRDAYHSNSRVTLASRKTAQGMRLSLVADESQQAVAAAQERQLAVLRASGAPPLPLRTRDRAVVREPLTPPVPAPESPVRIVAEDNPPERPAAIAAPAQRARAGSSQTVTRQAVQSQPAQVQPAPAVPVVTSHPEDDQPLLPVIPDVDLRN